MQVIADYLRAILIVLLRYAKRDGIYIDDVKERNGIWS